MLIKDFYSIEYFEIAEGKIDAQLRLNPEHEVYKGHFPNQPVVPGVIQLQIIKELMEKAGEQELLLSKMAFAKYLKMIIPELSPILTLQIDFSKKEGGFQFSAVIKDVQSIFTKVKGTFTFI